MSDRSQSPHRNRKPVADKDPFKKYKSKVKLAAKRRLAPSPEASDTEEVRTHPAQRAEPLERSSEREAPPQQHHAHSSNERMLQDAGRPADQHVEHEGRRTQNRSEDASLLALPPPKIPQQARRFTQTQSTFARLRAISDQPRPISEDMGAVGTRETEPQTHDGANHSFQGSSSTHLQASEPVAQNTAFAARSLPAEAEAVESLAILRKHTARGASSFITSPSRVLDAHKEGAAQTPARQPLAHQATHAKVVAMRVDEHPPVPSTMRTHTPTPRQQESAEQSVTSRRAEHAQKKSRSGPTRRKLVRKIADDDEEDDYDDGSEGRRAQSPANGGSAPMGRKTRAMRVRPARAVITHDDDDDDNEDDGGGNGGSRGGDDDQDYTQPAETATLPTTRPRRRAVRDDYVTEPHADASQVNDGPPAKSQRKRKQQSDPTDDARRLGGSVKEAKAAPQRTKKAAPSMFCR